MFCVEMWDLLSFAAPYLSRQTLDKSLFEGEKKASGQHPSQLKPEPSPAPPPSPASQNGPATPNPNADDKGNCRTHSLALLCNDTGLNVTFEVRFVVR